MTDPEPPRRENFASTKEHNRAYCRWREKHDPKRIAYKTEQRRKRTEAGAVKAYYEANKERLLKQKKVFYQANREAVRASQKAYREANLAKYRAKDRVYYLGNLASKAQGSAVLQAAPPWLTAEQWQGMNQIYEMARLVTEKTGVMHVVDHIFPLEGRLSCGLHVPWNLRIVTNQENILKHHSVDKFVR